MQIAMANDHAGYQLKMQIKAWLEENAEYKTNNGGNTDIAAVTALGYDAYQVAIEAIKKAGGSFKKVTVPQRKKANKEA